MPKPQKIEAVTKLKERFEQSDAAILTEFRGLKVGEMKELRRLLADTGTEFKVVKNTLGRIAAKEAKLDELLPLLEGSTAIAFIKGDPIVAAKGIDEIAKKYPSLVIKGGFLDGKVFGAERAQSLAKVKPREVLLSQLAGMLQSPIQKLAGLLQAPIRDLGYLLAAYKDKLEKDNPVAASAPAAEVAETETPAVEATEAPAVEATEAPTEVAEPSTEAAEASAEVAEPSTDEEAPATEEKAPESGEEG